MIQLNEACKILYNELRNDPRTVKYFNSLISRNVSAGGEEEELNLLGMHFMQVSDIYGKRTSFANLEIICKEEFSKGNIKDGARTLYRFGIYGKQDPEFIELAIKKRELKKAIEKIKSYIKDQFK